VITLQTDSHTIVPCSARFLTSTKSVELRNDNCLSFEAQRSGVEKSVGEQPQRIRPQLLRFQNAPLTTSFPTTLLSFPHVLSGNPFVRMMDTRLKHSGMTNQSSFLPNKKHRPLLNLRGLVKVCSGALIDPTRFATVYFCR